MTYYAATTEVWLRAAFDERRRFGTATASAALVNSLWFEVENDGPSGSSTGLPDGKITRFVLQPEENQLMEMCSPVLTFGTGISRDIEWGIPARDDAFIDFFCKCHVVMALLGEHVDTPGVYYAGWTLIEREGTALNFKEDDSSVWKPDFERTYSTIEDALRAARLNATTAMAIIRNDLHGGPPDRGGSPNRRARRAARHRPH